MEEAKAEPSYVAEVAKGEAIYTVEGFDWDPLPEDEESTHLKASPLPALNRLVESPLPTRWQIAAAAGSLTLVGLLSLLTAPWGMSGTALWLYAGGVTLIVASVMCLILLFWRSRRYGRELLEASYRMISAMDESTPSVAWDILDDAAAILTAHGLVDEALRLRVWTDKSRSLLVEGATGASDSPQGAQAPPVRVPRPRTRESNAPQRVVRSE